MAMGTTLKWCLVVLLALMFVLGPGASTAEAYIDPGTGSSLLSSLGVLLGVMCTVIALGFTQLKYWGGRLIAKLTARRAREEQRDESHQTP